MRHVGVRDFRDRATQYLAGEEMLVVDRYGEPIGVYIPVRSKRWSRSTEAIEQLEQTVQRVLHETGLTEAELIELFDLKTPVPDAPRAPRH